MMMLYKLKKEKSSWNCSKTSECKYFKAGIPATVNCVWTIYPNLPRVPSSPLHNGNKNIWVIFLTYIT